MQYNTDNHAMHTIIRQYKKTLLTKRLSIRMIDVDIAGTIFCFYQCCTIVGVSNVTHLDGVSIPVRPEYMATEDFNGKSILHAGELHTSI